MDIERRKKINKVTYSIIGVILLVWIIVASSTCGGSKDKTPESQVTSSRAWQIAKDMVKDKLKSPSTADFPWTEDRYTMLKDSAIMIIGHVDSQNSFGAMIRTNFSITLQYRGGEWSDIRNWQELNFMTLN